MISIDNNQKTIVLGIKFSYKTRPWNQKSKTQCKFVMTCNTVNYENKKKG